jgi:hypothetical protein
MDLQHSKIVVQPMVNIQHYMIHIITQHHLRHQQQAQVQLLLMLNHLKKVLNLYS